MTRFAHTALAVVLVLLGLRPAATLDGCAYCGLTPAVHRWRRLRPWRWAYARYRHAYATPTPGQINARRRIAAEENPS